MELNSSTVASAWLLSPFEQALPGKLHPTAGPAKVPASHHPHIPLLFFSQYMGKTAPAPESIGYGNSDMSQSPLMPESPFRVGGFLCPNLETLSNVCCWSVHFRLVAS